MFSIEATQIEQIAELVRRGACRSASEFVRAAIEERLRLLRERRLEDQVAKYCAVEHDEDGLDLVSGQAFDADR